MPRFTDRFIDSLKAEGTQRLEIKDDRCKGLAIRVTARTKTWCFRFKRYGRMQRISPQFPERKKLKRRTLLSI